MPDYARIVNGDIEQLGQPPALYRYPDGNWLDLRGMEPEQLAVAGWVAITETPQPPDTDTTTHTSSVTLVAGVPTRTWTEVPKPPVVPTAEERLAAAAAALAALDAIAAPVLTADVLDVLVDVRTALEA